jgi:hypothetical protein
MMLACSCCLVSEGCLKEMKVCRCGMVGRLVRGYGGCVEWLQEWADMCILPKRGVKKFQHTSSGGVVLCSGGLHSFMSSLSC